MGKTRPVIEDRVAPAAEVVALGPRETRSFDDGEPGPARQFVVDTLRTWADQRLVEDASIVIAELAANAWAHARTAYIVTVADLGDSVRISVADDCADPPVERDVGVWSCNGRGVRMVSRIATRWGVEYTGTGTGKTVWAELTRHGVP